MNHQTSVVLNDYFEKELGRSFLLPEMHTLSRHRDAFLTRFGPERIAAMSDAELLRQLPHNVTNDQPMDYWLEFKNDEEFDYRLFGSISGGSAAKFGTWQEKKTGTWRYRRPGARDLESVPESEAIAVIQERRNELLAAVEAVRSFADLPLSDIDPFLFQAAVTQAAPRWSNSTWLHKYLHLNFPSLVTWTATLPFSYSDLYRVGIVPAAESLYANDIEIVRFWSSLPALSAVPVELRYHAGRKMSPRDHWYVQLGEDTARTEELLTSNLLAFGPPEIGNLNEVSALSKKRDIQLAIETSFLDAGLDSRSPDARVLIELVYRLKEGSIITLFSDPTTVVAVGEVIGNYRFAPGHERPHQVPVRWHHTNPFQTSVPVETSADLSALAPTHPVVADIEASLIVHGIGPWPNFQRTVMGPPRATAASRGADTDSLVAEQLPPLEGLPRHVADMLDRKRQVILYGPPGTGKTYHAEHIALEIVARHNFHRVTSQLSDRQRSTIFGREGSAPYIATCTFHPMYSYEDFIEGYRPDGVSFKLEPGIFKRMAASAHAQPDKRFVLIIDEINRGNIPKIFGELITLLEASKRGTTSAHLPLSNEPFTVPDNLLVIGTMNTADRSILLLDTALRRRFAFKELLPDPQLLESGAIGDISLSTWLRALNRRIVEQLGRDGRNLQIGHAYLMPGGKPVVTLNRIGDIVRDELWPLLQEYCYEDANKLAQILAADRGGVFDRNTADLRFDLFEPGREDELAQALIAIVTPEDKKLDAILGEDVDNDTAPDDDRTPDDERS